MTNTLNARNIAALHEAVKHERERTDDLYRLVLLLQSAIAATTTELAAVKVQLVIVQSRLYGSGATS